MASEDVLERAESWLGSFCQGLTHKLERTDRLVSDLAAEVRELRAKLHAFEEIGRRAGELLNSGLQTEERLNREVLELRRDKARLDYLLDHLERDWRFPRWTHHRDLIDAAIRDAAMGG